MTDEIVVVSGLPRSGTSLMMQMLAMGGIEAMTDELRVPDTDNPRGYYEAEYVKAIARDASWLPQARGKVFKMVSQLLYDLPPGERYAVVFMQRDLDEMLVSQEKMLERLGRPAAPRDAMKKAFEAHLQRLYPWLDQQPNMRICRVIYNTLVVDPTTEASRVSAFLEGRVDVARMVEAVDPALYRNRKVVQGTPNV